MGFLREALSSTHIIRTPPSIRLFLVSPHPTTASHPAMMSGVVVSCLSGDDMRSGRRVASATMARASDRLAPTADDVTTVAITCSPNASGGARRCHRGRGRLRSEYCLRILSAGEQRQIQPETELTRCAGIRIDHQTRHFYCFESRTRHLVELMQDVVVPAFVRRAGAAPNAKAAAVNRVQRARPLTAKRPAAVSAALAASHTHRGESKLGSIAIPATQPRHNANSVTGPPSPMNAYRLRWWT